MKLQYFGHLMGRVDSLENTLILGGIGGPQDSSAMEHVTELPSFLRLNTIPLYVRTTSDIHSSVHEQMDAFYIWPL